MKFRRRRPFIAVVLGNAEMTDLFKCKKSGQMCCAPKSKIQEKQGYIFRNDTFTYPYNQQYQPVTSPQGVPPPPPNSIYQTNGAPAPMLTPATSEYLYHASGSYKWSKFRY